MGSHRAQVQSFPERALGIGHIALRAEDRTPGFVHQPGPNPSQGRKIERKAAATAAARMQATQPWARLGRTGSVAATSGWLAPPYLPGSGDANHKLTISSFCGDLSSTPYPGAMSMSQ
jgi:hypothetical protein